VQDKPGKVASLTRFRRPVGVGVIRVPAILARLAEGTPFKASPIVLMRPKGKAEDRGFLNAHRLLIFDMIAAAVAAEATEAALHSPPPSLFTQEMRMQSIPIRFRVSGGVAVPRVLSFAACCVLACLLYEIVVVVVVVSSRSSRASSVVVHRINDLCCLSLLQTFSSPFHMLLYENRYGVWLRDVLKSGRIIKQIGRVMLLDSSLSSVEDVHDRAATMSHEEVFVTLCGGEFGQDTKISARNVEVRGPARSCVGWTALLAAICVLACR
jgi:hypothetical protein